MPDLTSTPASDAGSEVSPPADRLQALRRATPDEQFDEVTRGCVDLHTAEELRELLKRSYESGVPLRVKAGFDPTSPDLHLGHLVLLQRLRRFQDFGHTVVFIVGDLTATIGDPTGRNQTRPPLTLDVVRANAETYTRQAFRVLIPEQTEVRHNSEWLGRMQFADVVKLASRYTVARLLERDDFSKRFKSGRPIAVHEFLYPLAQGWDSVEVRADVELGGTDQLFNLLVGRQLTREEGLRPQVVLTGPILEGIDARLDESGRVTGDKMSKSLGNFVGLDEPPHVQFQKLLPIVDPLLWRYMELLSSRPLDEIRALKDRVDRGELHPNEAKALFAREIVERFHGAEAAASAGAVQLRTLSVGGDSIGVSRLLVTLELAVSGSAAQRLVQQGGVSIDGQRVTDFRTPVGLGPHHLEVGKRHRLDIDLIR